MRDLSRFRARRHFVGGFTLIELSTVIVIIAILAVLLLPAVTQFTSRAERVKCTANLRTLHTGASSYIVERGSWPQVSTKGIHGSEYPKAWIAALAPFEVPPAAWICPSVQRMLDRPDVKRQDKARIDYIAMPFGSKPQAPYQWPGQPWFLERADVHGNGNLVVFPDGHVASLREIATQPMSQ